MKSFNRIVAVLAVFALATAAFTVPEEPAETENVELVEKLEQDTIEQADEDEMAAAEEQMKAAERDLEKAVERINALSRRKALARDREAVRKSRQLLQINQLRSEPPYAISAVGGGYAGRVLVIPDEDIGTGQLLTMMEDMNIMSRIIDKKLGQTHLAQEHAVHLLYMASAFDRSASETRSIYLDGYGALFLSRVDFPLAPAPRAEAEGTDHGYDPLWEQTKQEMYRVPKDYQPPWSSPEKVAEYDAEKVEELKRKLIRMLKHAVNIRGLNGGDWVVISITGSGRQSQATAVIRSYVAKDGKVITKTEKRPTMPSESYSPTVLTMRASKSDVDEFAEGNLDFDEFRERVQIFTY